MMKPYHIYLYTLSSIKRNRICFILRILPYQIGMSPKYQARELPESDLYIFSAIKTNNIKSLAVMEKWPLPCRRRHSITQSL